MPLKTVAIIQARMQAERLPGKVLMDIGGKPMLTNVIERVRPARGIDELIVATSDRSYDDPIEELCNELNIPCFRGSEEDCLDRLHQAAKSVSADRVIRLTSDNPLVNAAFVEWVIEQFDATTPPCDFMDTTISATFPHGLSVEMYTTDAMGKAWNEDTNPKTREHVTAYIIQHPELFNTVHLTHSEDVASQRWTVDTAEDLQFVQTVFQHFTGSNLFTWEEALRAIQKHPEWLEINSAIKQKPVPRSSS